MPPPRTDVGPHVGTHSLQGKREGATPTTLTLSKTDPTREGGIGKTPGATSPTWPNKAKVCVGERTEGNISCLCPGYPSILSRQIPKSHTATLDTAVAYVIRGHKILKCVREREREYHTHERRTFARRGTPGCGADSASAARSASCCEET